MSLIQNCIKNSAFSEVLILQPQSQDFVLYEIRTLVGVKSGLRKV
jgi:hypothetical protein